MNRFVAKTVKTFGALEPAKFWARFAAATEEVEMNMFMAGSSFWNAPGLQV